MNSFKLAQCSLLVLIAGVSIANLSLLLDITNGKAPWAVTTDSATAGPIQAQPAQLKTQAATKHQDQIQPVAEIYWEGDRTAQKEPIRQHEIGSRIDLAKQQELSSIPRGTVAPAAAKQMANQVGTYVDYMASLIASNWSRPQGAPNGTQVLLQVTLGAAGKVLNVKTVKSSGNPTFDRSAEDAVKKVGAFSRLQEMDSAIYNREFRKINILFNPQDLRM